MYRAGTSISFFGSHALSYVGEYSKRTGANDKTGPFFSDRLGSPLKGYLLTTTRAKSLVSVQFCLLLLKLSFCQATWFMIFNVLKEPMAGCLDVRDWKVKKPEVTVTTTNIT